MLAHFLVAGMLLQAAAYPQVVAKPSTPQAVPSAPKNADLDDPQILLKVKRIYVESFGEDVISKELQSMIVSSLVATKRFKVTENRERADAILKGVALERTSQELHAYGESTAVGGGHSEISGSGGTISGSSSGGFVARHMGTRDLHSITIASFTKRATDFYFCEFSEREFFNSYRPLHQLRIAVRKNVVRHGGLSFLRAI